MVTILDLAKNFKPNFDINGKVNKDTETSNGINTETSPAIFIRPKNNFQGSYKSLNLNPGRY